MFSSCHPPAPLLVLHCNSDMTAVGVLALPPLALAGYPLQPQLEAAEDAPVAGTGYSSGPLFVRLPPPPSPNLSPLPLAAAC
jgi:hypothetical protein